MSVLIADEWFVARKAHVCCVCLGDIAPGDRYHRQRSVEGGDAYVWKEHALCGAAYLVAHREADLLPDEGCEYEDVQPVLLRFFTALSGSAT